MTGKCESELPERVLNQLRRFRCAARPLLVAVSGGPDSMALLSILLTLRERNAVLKLYAAHVHHGLRGEDADQDEALVRAFCQEHRIRFVRATIRIEPHHGNVEGTARRLRYDALARLALPRTAVVLTAHTLSDQAETFVLKLCRGAGPSGLSGIRECRRHLEPDSRRTVTVVRPLLATTREELEGWLERNQVPSRVDSTNFDCKPRRNWIRHQLLPELARHLNPGVIDHLARTAGLMRGIDLDLRRRARRFIHRHCQMEPSGRTLPVPALRRLPPVLRNQVFREFLSEGGQTPSPLTSRHLAQITTLLKGHSGRRVKLPGNLEVSRELDHILRQTDPPIEDFEFLLPLPGRLRIPSLEVELEVQRAEASEADFLTRDTELTVRNRRGGDRVPYTVDGKTRRLKGLFLELRIPAWRRDRIILILDSAGIVWMDGIPLHPKRRGNVRGWRVLVHSAVRSTPENDGYVEG